MVIRVLFVASLAAGFLGCSSSGPKGPFMDPKTVMPTSELKPVRGFVPKRGIIHQHSPYSHDACDGQPFFNSVCLLPTNCKSDQDCPAQYTCNDTQCVSKAYCATEADCQPGYSCVTALRNEPCYKDVRAAMCWTKQDFVFLTDHASTFADHEYPDVLLHQDGDNLIQRGGLPVANRVNCGDGSSVIVAAGTEQAMMPIGIEHHLGDTPAVRRTAYDTQGADAIAALQAAGALVFLQHTEGWDISYILDNPIDGIEMYNTHQNMINNAGEALQLINLMTSDPTKLPVGELLIIPLFQENDADMLRWSRAVAQKPMPAVLATDAHQNAFQGDAGDGERIDSFRRLMHWFSNYVLVPQGEIDDTVLKAAIKHGRVFGVFHFLGYPVGFDYHAEAGGQIYEMGDQVPAGAAAVLKLTLPAVYRLDPKSTPPQIHGRILKANDSGGWDEVATGAKDLSFSASTGVYRAEIRMTPNHLRPWLGSEPDTYLKEMIWIYSNAIYVGMNY